MEHLTNKKRKLSDEHIRAHIERRVNEITDRFKKNKHYSAAKGFATPTFESQEDFDNCRPEDRGIDFRQHNELVAGVIQGLRRNSIPAEAVRLRYADFSRWLRLNRQPLSPESRATYAALLMGQAHLDKRK